MKTRHFFGVAVLVLLLAVPTAAQQIQPVTWVADFHVKPEKSEQFMDLVKKYNQPVFEKLMAEGAVLAWGVDVPMLHEPGGATHTFWWTSPDMAALDKVFVDFAAMEQKLMDDDKAAAAEARRRGRPAPKGLMESFLETVDLSKHKDYLLRELITSGGGTPPAAGSKPYTWINLIRVQPGKGDEFLKLWRDYNKAVYDKLVADGAIHGYGLGIEAARSSDAFTHFVVISMPNLGAHDKLRAAFEADRAARSAAERSIITHSFREAVDGTASRSFILRSVIFQAAAPPKP